MKVNGRIIGFTLFAMSSILVTGLIWNTLQNSFARGSLVEYSAMFHNVAGLHTNDHVRIAGVRVGKVDKIQLVGTEAKVTFSVERDQPVYLATTVAVRYQNLIGQRFLALERPAEPSGGKQPPGSTIPISRTKDSLDLSRLLNGFQPVFNLLTPADVNKLAGSLIKAFDGQGPATDDALNQIASLSQSFAGRDEVFAAVIDNLTPVLRELAGSGAAYHSLLTQSRTLVTGLAHERKAIGNAVDGVADLVVSVGNLVSRIEAPTKTAVTALNGAMLTFVPQSDLLMKILKRLPSFLDDFGRVSMHGSWFDLYPCHLDGTVPNLLGDGVLSDVGGHHHSETCS